MYHEVDIPKIAALPYPVYQFLLAGIDWYHGELKKKRKQK
jgi:hypothetical protein